MRLTFHVHESLDLSPSSPIHSSHYSHTSYPILVIAIVGILAISFLLVSYYIFVIKWNRIDPLRRLSRPSLRRVGDPLMVHAMEAENRGLEEAAIRAIPILEFKKDERFENAECAVCLNEFQENERLRSIPNCSHMFHIDCIDVWLQNNANCPLCRNSISISSMDQFMLPMSYSAQNPSIYSDNFTMRDEDFVVIEIGGEEQNHGVQERLNSGELSGHVPISPSPRKLHQKMLHKKSGKKLKHVSSTGDECIDVGKKDENFLVQPIRRSISMDSAADRHLYLAVQEIIQKHRQKNDDDAREDEGSSNNNRVKRSFFSFGNGRGSKNIVLPVDLEM